MVIRTYLAPLFLSHFFSFQKIVLSDVAVFLCVVHYKYNILICGVYIECVSSWRVHVHSALHSFEYTHIR